MVKHHSSNQAYSIVSMIFTGLLGIFLVFVDLTGSLPISTKPMTSSDLVPGVVFYSQNNKLLFKNKMIPTIETPKVASKSRNLGSNPYGQTYFRSRPNQTTSQVTESRLVKPTDFKLKLVGDAKTDEIQTKSEENIHPPKTLCGKSSESESESSEEESSEELSTGDPLSQCNSSEEGSGSESSEEKSGENNTSEEGTENTEAYGDEKTGENTTSEEGAEKTEASGGQKVSENTTLKEDKEKKKSYAVEKEAEKSDQSEENGGENEGSSEGKSNSEENEDEKKNSEYKTEEKTTSNGIKPADTSEESENEYSKSSGKIASEENSESSGKSEEKSDEDQTTPVIYPLTEVYYTTTDTNLPDEYTTNESNPSDEIVATTDSSNENNDATTEYSTLNEINYATTQVNYLDQNNVVTTENSLKETDPPTTEYKSEPMTELPVFGKKLTDNLPITSDNSLNVDKLPTPREDKKKIYNDDDPTIFYLGTKKLIPYYLRRSTSRKYPEGNKTIQKSPSITIGGTQRIARAKNPIESADGKTPKITTGGTQRDYALTGRFPPRTARKSG